MIVIAYLMMSIFRFFKISGLSEDIKCFLQWEPQVHVNGGDPPNDSQGVSCSLTISFVDDENKQVLTRNCGKVFFLVVTMRILA